MKQDILLEIEDLLNSYDAETLDAILIALRSITDDSGIKRKLCKRIEREHDSSKLKYIYEILIRL